MSRSQILVDSGGMAATAVPARRIDVRAIERHRRWRNPEKLVVAIHQVLDAALPVSLEALTPAPPIVE